MREIQAATGWIHHRLREYRGRMQLDCISQPLAESKKALWPTTWARAARSAWDSGITSTDYSRQSREAMGNMGMYGERLGPARCLTREAAPQVSKRLTEREYGNEKPSGCARVARTAWCRSALPTRRFGLTQKCRTQRCGGPTEERPKAYAALLYKRSGFKC